MSWKSTKLKKSNNDWLNSGKAVIQYLVKTCDFRVSVLPGSTEALVRRSGKINYNLIACSLGNIPAKNYKYQ